jgi:hypothetical protein
MRRNFLLTTIIFVLSLVIFWITITQLDPLGEQRYIAIFSFFLSVFFMFTTFFTFFFFFAAELFSHRRLGTASFLIAIRRGFFTGFFVVFITTLKLYQLLDVVQIILCAMFLIFIELIFLTAKRF